MTIRWARVRITHLSRKGQLTIPVALRKDLGWTRNDPLTIELHPDTLRIHKMRRASSL